MKRLIARRARRSHWRASASLGAMLLGWALPASGQVAGSVAPSAPPQDAARQSGTVSPSGDQGVAGPQEGSSGAGDEIVVTGVRASLSSAQAIKRNSDQIVDSIVAEDIGKLPDRNVAEALQRITGIQIQRSFGEGSSVAIRGLSQVRTEINGRDVFTANGGRTLSLEDVPSELLAGIDVYKNPSAELIEGGLHPQTVRLRRSQAVCEREQQLLRPARNHQAAGEPAAVEPVEHGHRRDRRARRPRLPGDRVRAGPDL